MAKKDKPKPKESGNWKPGNWTFNHLRRFMRHVLRHAWSDANAILGPPHGSYALESFLAGAKDREAEVQMRHLGVRTIGDAEREKNEHL